MWHAGVCSYIQTEYETTNDWTGKLFKHRTIYFAPYAYYGKCRKISIGMGNCFSTIDDVQVRKRTELRVFRAFGVTEIFQSVYLQNHQILYSFNFEKLRPRKHRDFLAIESLNLKILPRAGKSSTVRVSKCRIFKPPISSQTSKKLIRTPCETFELRNFRKFETSKVVESQVSHSRIFFLIQKLQSAENLPLFEVSIHWIFKFEIENFLPLNHRTVNREIRSKKLWTLLEGISDPPEWD